jgi:hypothetical protein|tara:strand:+ start:2536 stop:2739 length:204 start_codon:yes stop_codon:yes gene_type:complete
MEKKVSNLIKFPMDRVRISPTGEDFFLDHAIRIEQHAIDLEEETERMLEQAKAIEEQSQRILDMMKL